MPFLACRLVLVFVAAWALFIPTARPAASSLPFQDRPRAATTVPAGEPPSVTKITLDKPGILENDSCTATVTLDKNVTVAPVTVEITISDAAFADAPMSVTVPVGAKTASFIITGKVGGGAEKAKYVDVSAKSGGWIQACPLTVMRASTDLKVQNLSAHGGYNLVMLMWRRLPNDAVKGYRVLRRNGSSWVALNPALYEANTFADTTAVNGTSYSYKVGVEDWRGVVTYSPVVSASPKRSSPVLKWESAPSAVIGFAKFLSVVNPNKEMMDVSLVVDGKIVSDGTNDVYGPSDQ